MNKVFIRSLSEQGVEPEDLRLAFEWLDWERLIPYGSKVFIKPNLTWPIPLPGVTTSPKAMESLAVLLKERTDQIIFGESDGGYHAYEVEDAFEGHQLYALRDKYGIGVVNLTDQPAENFEGIIGGKKVSVNLPSFLLHDIDVFITMPVPKTHVMTKVSLAFKNQWGCIPSPMRLREHYDFDHKIILINRLLQPKLSVVDGTYFLSGAGPMTGDAIRMNLLIVGDDIGATSSITCEIMGFSPNSIQHFKAAKREGLFPHNHDEIITNVPISQFKSFQFDMSRALLDWISLIGFRSRFLTYLFWDSSFANTLHKFLFLVRKNPQVARILYGRAGQPPSWIEGD